MGKLDKALGGVLFLIALPLAFAADAHWSAIVLLLAAGLTYIAFIVPGKRERCGNCGYYYVLTVFESYFAKPKSKQCASCATERAAHSNQAVAGE